MAVADRMRSSQMPNVMLNIEKRVNPGCGDLTANAMEQMDETLDDVVG